MAKMKRSVLKQLIKECLVEILIEGIDSESGVEALVEASRPRPSSNRRKDKYESELKRIEKQRAALDSKKVNEDVIKSITSDSVMADILRDTAQTTLVEQGVKNSQTTQHRTASDAASQAVATNDLEDLFEGVGNWANLAFSSADNSK